MHLAPLVDPAAPLTRAEMERYARHVLLPGIGTTGQRRLRAARVLVVGAGGLGCPALQYLVAAGVGAITVVDDDVVDATNLQRQVLHGEADVERPKVDSAVEALRRQGDGTTLVGIRRRVEPDTVLDLMRGHHLVVVVQTRPRDRALTGRRWRGRLPGPRRPGARPGGGRGGTAARPLGRGLTARLSRGDAGGAGGVARRQYN